MSVVGGGGDPEQKRRVAETELNTKPSIDSLLMIVDRISRDVTRHVTPPDDDVTAASAVCNNSHSVHRESITVDVPGVSSSLPL